MHDADEVDNAVWNPSLDDPVVKHELEIQSAKTEKIE